MKAPSAAAASEPVAEKRRVLPSLIVPDVPDIEAAPPPAVEEPPRRPRGRPRKVPLVASAPLAASAPVAAKAEVAAEVAVAVAPEPATVVAPEPAETVRSAPPPRKRKDLPASELPRGERWKTRRLGRWSR